MLRFNCRLGNHIIHFNAITIADRWLSTGWQVVNLARQNPDDALALRQEGASPLTIQLFFVGQIVKDHFTGQISCHILLHFLRALFGGLTRSGHLCEQLPYLNASTILY